MTPFPALHTTANQEADNHLSAARKLATDAEAWLADLDAVLSDSSAVVSGRAASTHSARR